MSLEAITTSKPPPILNTVTANPRNRIGHALPNVQLLLDKSSLRQGNFWHQIEETFQSIGCIKEGILLGDRTTAHDIKADG